MAAVLQAASCGPARQHSPATDHTRCSPARILHHTCVQALTTADEVGRVAYHAAAPYLLPVLDRGLKAADSLGKSHLHRDLGLYHSSRSIWS
jgi:hypothetical protein